jgi:hypothetical protein
MLKKMGWSEDKGLGKDENGSQRALKVSKKDDMLGLGMKADNAGNLAWNATTSSYNEILNMLQVRDFADSGVKIDQSTRVHMGNQKRKRSRRRLQGYKSVSSKFFKSWLFKLIVPMTKTHLYLHSFLN